MKMSQEVRIDVRWRDPMIGRDLLVGGPARVAGTHTVEDRPRAGRPRACPAAEGIAMTEAQLLTLDPGHFHAALVQKESYPGVARRVHVYAPLGPDLFAHLGRIAGFNQRRDNPTGWELEIHAGPDFLARL